jgi:hypothetical protein
MTIPFYTENIIEPLQSLLKTADADGNFEPIIDFCTPLIPTTTDDGVILCYTFALMEQAMAIHVDDITSTGNRCLTLLKRIQHEYGGTSHWRVMIKRILKEDKRRKQEVDNLSNIDYSTLSYSQKSKLAYNLQDKNTLEANTKAAAIHKELVDHKDNNQNSYYHLGQYIVCLYRMNEEELADKVFTEFANKMREQPTHGYAFLINYCYEVKVLSCLHDKTKMEKTWHEAFAHPAFTTRNGFPVVEDAQDKTLLAAHMFGLTEIKKYIIPQITATRKPRMIAAEIKKIIENELL